ncbi:MAG: NAD(P)/FAD-dependent oxidoreductase [Christensenellales bacterium]
MKYVIIGNSAAGIGAIEGIRQHDKTGEIVVISNEPHHTYSRPLISYLIQGKTDRQKMKYRDDTFYERMNCQTMLLREAESIEPAAQLVTLDGGETVYYDKLFIGTGSSPFVPPMKGLETVEKQFSFMKLDDATALDDALFSEARVLIVGAGLIGLKCAEGIEKKVKSITVIDLAPRVLSSILDDDGSKMVQNHLEKSGLIFYLGTSVEEFSKTKAKLKTGETVDFDILVLAVGVKPNVSLLKEAGGEVGRGIIVNERMETSIPNVYAAGDCTESDDISCKQRRILALLPWAFMRGEAAGVNMAGGHKIFDKAIPMNAIGFFGLHMITAGSYTGEAYVSLEEGYKKLFYQDGVLKGYIIIGNVEKAGIYTNLIREQLPLDSIDFDLVCKKPGLMAFCKKDREVKLGGVPR